MTPTKTKILPLDGFLLLDKPKFLSSNEALQRVKRLLRVKKAGHTGSLDPMATGMLPICFGEATKYSKYLLDADKKYDVIAKLGEQTTTGDTEGTVIAQKEFAHLSVATIQEKINSFVGEVAQIPSMFSAIKYQGKPLYELARQGIEVPREVRKIQIYSIEFLSYENGLLSLRVHCSKGTYIRNLVEDIGHALGCGAHVLELRRLTVGQFNYEQMYTLDALTHIETTEERRTLILPIPALFPHWPIMKLSADARFYICRGQPVQMQITGTPVGYVRLMAEDDMFIGVGELLDDGRLLPRRLMQTPPNS